MEILDIHAHILPGVDDGAKDIEESLKLLEMLKEQGVGHVLATPHFIAMRDNMDDYKALVNEAFAELTAKTANTDMPRIYLGSEVLYFPGMGTADGIRDLTLNNSEYRLLEFGGDPFNDAVCRDICNIRDNLAIIPIIAHIERYKKFGEFSNLLDLVSAGVCKAQINASSITGNAFTRTAHRLLKKGLVHYIGSDAHSPEQRPPKIKEAYEIITAKYGKWQTNELIMNSEKLLERIRK